MRMLLLLVIAILSSCGEQQVIIEEESSELTLTNSTSFEGTSSPSFNFEITLESALTDDLVLDYKAEGITAEPGVDFEDAEGQVTITAGELKGAIQIPIVNDEVNEVDEQMKLVLTAPSNVTIKSGGGIGTIKDDDEPIFGDPSGYFTADNFFGYELVWEEEFDGSELDPSLYNYEYGDNGWGNNEWQNYTDAPENSQVADSKLTITARQNGDGDYTSARIQTKGKKEFKFGRIDVRARLPKGQGIWPAIWMLGSNIDAVSWPACGEIDIMELVGHEPKSVHGTAHWGLRGEASTYITQTYTIDEDFAEQFHVFSIVWEFNKIEWYVDETLYHSVTSTQMQGKPYPFNQDFFFIFNVAVGGNWPGYPDETTEFPQSMEIDYIRVFQ